MANSAYPKKLIEVALPLTAVNDAARSEMKNPFIKGHPKSLKWWARRPLASCRAVLFAQIVDDPSSDPEKFPTEEDQDKERARLFALLESVLDWTSSKDENAITLVRDEIAKYVTPGAEILDPFSGGASFPIEAARLGLRTTASDLNPVAVQIARSLIEVPARWQGAAPAAPEADTRTRWHAAEGLAEDLRHYAARVTEMSSSRVGHLYGSETRHTGTPTTWIWARVGRCTNPVCGVQFPLTGSFWLSKKKGRRAWIDPVDDGEGFRFEIRSGSGEAPTATKQGRGASFACLRCGTVISRTDLREQLSGKAEAMLMAVLMQAGRTREFVGSDRLEFSTFGAMTDTPDLPDDARAWWFKGYGLSTYGDMFTDRQSAVLSSLAQTIRDDIRASIEKDAAAAGWTPEQAAQYSLDMCLLLNQALMRCVMFGSSLCSWNVTNENITNPFGMTAPTFAWDFAEANLLDGPLGFTASGGKVAEVIDSLPTYIDDVDVYQADAATPDRPSPDGGFIVSTDPPYYDNVTYSDMADAFYLWSRRALRATDFPELATIRSPSDAEIVANASRFKGDLGRANEHFEDSFRYAFKQLLDVASSEVPMTMVYAFKQAELTADDGVVSTGWSSMLDALLDGGWAITATWPMVMEREARRRGQDSNALASSVVLALRPRVSGAPTTDRQGFVRALAEGLPGPLHELQKANIAPVDLRQASIGPGMAVFSRFGRVLESDGSRMRARTALGLINQVLGQVLDEQEHDFDAETRWAIHWFAQYFFDEASYGVAEQLAVSMNVSVGGLVHAGVVHAAGGKARLVSREELPDDWDPAGDPHVPVWEGTQHLVRRLETEGETSAARLLRRMGGLGESAQLLAYRLYTVCERTRPNLAGPYNALVASWPEIQRLAREASEPYAETEQQSFEV